VNNTQEHYKDQTILLALERGYREPQIIAGRLVVRDQRTGRTVDYVEEILIQYPDLYACAWPCTDWQAAARLMGLLPPAR
jgi:hypothetical protein